MFFKYPYTDMYNLNLDWMLQAIREVQEIIAALGSVVNTVNGESGDVVISDEMINAAGVGVLQTYSAPTTIGDLTPAQLLSLYDNGKRIVIFRNTLNVFDRVYFLQKNGSTVTAVYYDPGSFMAGVRSVNGLSGDILLNAANLPVNNLPDAPTTGIVITGVQQDIGDTADLETTAHVLVTAINELLAALNVEETARADGDDAVFAEMAETVALLLTVDDSNIAEETISVGQYVYFDGILYQCIAGITSGVTEITDLTLATYLTQVPAGGLNDLNADLRSLISDEATARTNADDTLNSQIVNIENCLAIVANGDTHAAIESGQYVFVKNHNTLPTGMYYNKTSNTISQNETLTVNNLGSVQYGALNNDSPVSTELSVIADVTASINKLYRLGNMYLFTLQFTCNTDVNAYSAIFRGLPLITPAIDCVGFNISTHDIVNLYITSNNIYARQTLYANNTYVATLTYFKI